MRRRFFISFENWPEKPAKRFEGQTHRNTPKTGMRSLS